MPVVAIDTGQFVHRRLAGQMLQSGGGINQSAIKEDPAGTPLRLCAIRQGKRDCLANKGDSVVPWQSMTAGFNFARDDAPARLFDHGMTAP